MIQAPCVKECPDRNTYCRLNCEKFKVYQTLKNQEYKDRERKRAQQELAYDYRERTKKRLAWEGK